MPNRDWSQFDFSHPLTTSASAITKYRSCPRSWVFAKVWRLKEPRIQAGPFGDATHDAIERWLRADETGRGPDGKPVEVWPKGWDHELSMTESGLIKMLVDKAIEAGHITREPGTEPEVAFQRDVAPGISVMGFGDVFKKDAYEDHKTTKNFRYCESPDSLAVNVQMIIGAAEVITRAMEAGVPIDQVTIAHNYFHKDPQVAETKKVPKALTVDYVKQFWAKGVEVEEKNGEKRWVEGIVPTCKEMLKVKQAGEKDWEKIEGPREKGACTKYRGCPFQTICGGTETVENYKERMKMVAAIEQSQSSAERSDDVSIFDQLRKDRGETTAPVAEPEAVETTPEPSTEPREFTATEAPWFNEGCVSCSGNAVPGFNSRGEVCRACEAASEIKPGDFTQTLVDGTLVLTNKQTNNSFMIENWIVKPEAKKTPDAAPPKKATPTPPKKARENVEKDEPPKRTGRPKVGFTMIYGSVKRGKRNVKDLNVVLKDTGADLAQAMGKSSYYEIDFGQRRDLIATKAEQIAESLGAAFVVVSNVEDADVRAFAAALEPYATYVIVASA